MKKLKILPSILMLVLCVGVLAVGVFAITPTTNTISGTITINASNKPVKIELLKDDQLVKTYNEVRSGITWNINELAESGNTSILFDTEGKNKLIDVPNVKFTLRITNLSDTPLGAFFLDEELTLSNGVYAPATKANVKGDHVLKDSTDKISPVANVYLSTYKAIGPAVTTNGTTTYETVDMDITLEMADFYTTSKSASINYNLILEEYVATSGYATGSGLVKLPYKVAIATTQNATWGSTTAPTATISSTFTDKTNLEIVVIPSTITTIGDSTFSNAKYLFAVSVPNSLSAIGKFAFSGCSALTNIDLDDIVNLSGTDTSDTGIFQNCTSLKTIVIPKGITTVPEVMFASCTSLEYIKLSSTVNNVSGYDAFAYFSSVKVFEFDGCQNVTNTLMSQLFSFQDFVEKVIVKKGTTFASEYTLDTYATGHTCSGWNIAKIATTHAEDTVYTCTWTPKTYKITLYLNGGNVDGNTSNIYIYVTFGQKVGTLPIPEKEGYKFSRWYWLDAGQITITEDTVLDHYQVDMHPPAFYAEWTAV